MTRADLIAAVRIASGKPMMSERECLAIVRGVLGVVREPSEGMVQAGIIQAEVCTFEWTSAAPCVAEHILPAMIGALLREVGE